MRRLALLLVVGLGAIAPAHAVEPDEILPNAALEQRARSISGGLRCLVCQNQSIDESDAPLARDLRILVRERLQAGDSDGAVRDFIVARYGEFVLLSPPLSWRTAALWGAPFLILMASLAYIGRRTRRMAAPVGAIRPLSDDERRRLDKLTQE